LAVPKEIRAEQLPESHRYAYRKKVCRGEFSLRRCKGRPEVSNGREKIERAARSLWDFGEFLHKYAKIPINEAPLGVCKV
jgi:hypothetical protein